MFGVGDAVGQRARRFRLGKPAGARGWETVHRYLLWFFLRLRLRLLLLLLRFWFSSIQDPATVADNGVGR